MTAVLDQYEARVARGELSDDPAQRAAAQSLDALAQKLAVGTRRNWFSGKGPKAPGGMYIWGGVGRGKSMLMDIFVDTLPNPRKRRIHFHAFMQDVHTGMNAARAEGKTDALAPVADALIADLRVLALDEMQISDIADAMIVGRLFDRLLAGGVSVVTTSNRPPHDLYKDGLNRALFLPFIDLIETQLEVVELDAATDYRQSRLQGARTYFAPSDSKALAEVDAIWQSLTGGSEAPLDLTIKGRKLRLPRFHNGAARMPFADLCDVPLGAADYLAIADTLRVLVLEDIPKLSAENFDAAKRFVTLVDALYEARVHLIATAAAAPDKLYTKGTGSFEFERTASRLIEMQSKDWASDAPA